jgi:hypothetical protein
VTPTNCRVLDENRNHFGHAQVQHLRTPADPAAVFTKRPRSPEIPPVFHQPSHVAHVKAGSLFGFGLFAAARVPARCASSALPQQSASSALPQQNIPIIPPGAAHSSL